MTESSHDSLWYAKEAESRFGDRFRREEILIEEARQNQLFDEEKYRAARNEIKRAAKEGMESYMRKQEQANRPKCPTCGSTNVSKISDLRKAGGALMFGLFSKTARSQFECGNCGYKW